MAPSLLPSPTGSPIGTVHSRFGQPFSRGPSRRILPRVIVMLALLVVTVVSIAVLHGAHRRQMVYDYVREKKPQIKQSPMFRASNKKLAKRVDCSFSPAELVATHNLTKPFKFTRKHVRARPTDWLFEPKDPLDVPMTRGERFIPPFQLVDAAKAGEEEQELARCDRGVMTLPTRFRKPGVPTSDIMFGMATSYERLKRRLPTLEQWLAGYDARLIVILPGEDRNWTMVAAEMLNRHNIRGYVVASSQGFVDRYLMLIDAFWQHREPLNKWFAFIDDDTFIPSIPALVARLRKQDHTKEVYYGTLSEDFGHLRWSGFMAFGGAGIYISLPLLAHLHAVYPACIWSSRERHAGDEKLSNCIYTHTATKLTLDFDLHQMDLVGNPTGLLESGRKMLSLHHFDSYFHLNMTTVGRSVEMCDKACLFQRHHFARANDEFSSVLFTNGFTITGFSPGVEVDLRAVEATWSPDLENVGDRAFEHSLAPLRPKLLEGRERFTHRLEHVRRTPTSLVQTYIMRTANPWETDTVIEVVWLA